MSPSLPSTQHDDRAHLKQQAAEYAVRFIQSGMRVGLGTGSTAYFATRRIAQLIHDGILKDIIGFPTSKAAWQLAEESGIPLMNDSMPANLDLTIDGADEVDPNLNLIKGGGGALFREKIVAQATRREIIAVDDSKLTPDPRHTFFTARRSRALRMAVADAISRITRRHAENQNA